MAQAEQESPRLTENEDAYGRELLDYYNEEEDVREIIEREDGWIGLSNGPAQYFLAYEDWPDHQKASISYAHGRVLDVGCGAGRVCLYLQAQGLEVVGIDNSPLALEVCRLRGCKNVSLTPIEKVGPQLGTFDTIVMFGNNFGLFGSFEKARRLLEKFHKVTRSGAVILAESNNVHKTNNPDHLAYQEWNRQRGRLPGQLHLRVRYRKYASPWFDYLIVSPKEMQKIVEGTGWKVADLFTSEETPMYAARIVKE